MANCNIDFLNNMANCNIDFLNNMANFLAPSNTFIALIGEMAFYTFCIAYMAYKLFNIARTKPPYSKESKLEERLYILGVIVLMIVNIGIYNTISDREFVNKNRVFKEVPIDGKNNINFYKAIIRNPVYQAMSEADKNAIKQAIFSDVTCLNVRFCESYLKDDVQLVHLNSYLQFLLDNLDKKEYNAPVGENQINSLADVAMYHPYKRYTIKKYGERYFDSQQHFFAFNNKGYQIKSNALKEFERLETEFSKTWE